MAETFEITPFEPAQFRRASVQDLLRPRDIAVLPDALRQCYVAKVIGAVGFRAGGPLRFLRFLCVRQRDGNVELFEIGEKELTAVPASDPRSALKPRYAKETDWYEAWAYWRHLKRSQAPDVAKSQQENPPTPPAKPVQDASLRGG